MKEPNPYSEAKAFALLQLQKARTHAAANPGLYIASLPAPSAFTAPRPIDTTNGHPFTDHPANMHSGLMWAQIRGLPFDKAAAAAKLYDKKHKGHSARVTTLAAFLAEF